MERRREEQEGGRKGERERGVGGQDGDKAWKELQLLVAYLLHLQLEVLFEERVEVDQRRMLEKEGVPSAVIIGCHVSQYEAHPQNDILQKKSRSQCAKSN